MEGKSWLPIPRGSHFSLSNIPFGIITTAASQAPRTAIAIGDQVLDLAVFSSNSGFSELPSIQPHISVFSQPTLNAFAALGRQVHRRVRNYLRDIFTEDTTHPAVLKENAELRQKALFPLKDIQTHLPLQIGDYTDFYAGLNHAYNVGVMFRGPANALQPNYTHLPVGYHGRASSVVVSGTPIRRSWGQILENPGTDPKVPVFTQCKKLDLELELGAFVCRANKMGEPIPINRAGDFLFGFVLVNDWSARDVQAWEYVPLGPFNSKNFGTTVSAWVVLPDALEPFLVKGLKNKTELQAYLREERKENVYDIKLEVDLTSKCSPIWLLVKTKLMTSFPAKSGTTTIIRTSSCNLLWSFPQMLAHHSINGCPMQVGDLLASGTISGTEPGTEGSLLEQSQNGKVALKLQGGDERKFLEDGDVVTIRGVCGDNENNLVGFGECTGRIEPAIQNWSS
jgi:fumarylacetoacetase